MFRLTFTQLTVAQTENFVENCGFHRFENMAFRIAGAGSSMTIAILLKDWNQPEIKASEQP